jgi:olefin beta-lactone synthetase
VGTGDGVCVGRPRSGVIVAVSALDDLGRAVGEPVSEPGTVGEVLIRADHVKDTYVRLWHTEHLASTPAGWHRSGDVGFVDGDGYLWIGGRLQHVITTATGPLMPVALELAAESATGAPRAAAVGVGPRGAQVVALVIEDESASRSGALADAATAARVRTAVAAISTVDVAAVVTVARLPVDRRHNSKIDRTAVASWVSAMLAGERVGRP